MRNFILQRAIITLQLIFLLVPMKLLFLPKFYMDFFEVWWKAFQKNTTMASHLIAGNLSTPTRLPQMLHCRAADCKALCKKANTVCEVI